MRRPLLRARRRAAASPRPARGSRRRALRHAPQLLANAPGDLSGASRAPSRSDDPLREALRQLAGRPPSTRSRNATPSPLDPVGRRRSSARAASLDRHSRRNVRSGAGRRAATVQLEHRVDAEAAGDALVGERGVEEAVADDVGAAVERRPDDLLDELRPRGREERRLGPGRDRAVAQQELPDPLAELRPSRLARRDDLAALGSQPLGEEPRLGRLPRAVDPLEGDEHGGSVGQGPASGIVIALREFTALQWRA